MWFERLAYATIALLCLEPFANAEPTSAAADQSAPKVVAAAQVIEPATPSSEPLPAISAPAAIQAKPTPPPVTLVANVDLTAQRMTVLANGKTIHTFAISSGAQGYATPTGNFRPEWMAKMWHSKQYDDAEMPHAVFFKNGAAIHATKAVGQLGRPASHGCVRLAPANAETFYKLVQKHSLVQTRVNVFGTPKYPVLVADRRPQNVNRVAYVNAYQPAGYGSGFNGGGSWFGGNGYAKPYGAGVYAAPPQQYVQYQPRPQSAFQKRPYPVTDVERRYRAQ